MSDLPPPPGSPPHGVPLPSYPTPPPGYVQYGAPAQQAYGTRLQFVGGVGKALGVLLMIFIPLQALGLYGTYTLADDAKDFLDGEITQRQFEDANTTNLANIGGLLVIPIAVLTMILMFRMAKNLQSFGRDQTWKPGWAIGGWFCPPLVLYIIPFLMFRELWKGAELSADANTWKSTRVPPIVTVWWVLYGLAPLAGIVSAAGFLSNIRGMSSEDLAEQLDDFLVVNLILAAVSLIATIVYWRMIRQLVDRHRRFTGEP
jgi:hypothetical protein